MVIEEKINIKHYLDKSKFQSDKLIEFLHSNNLGVLIILDFIKPKDWPYFKEKLYNEPKKNIPLIWALFYSEDGKNVKIAFEIHPMKFYPRLYQSNNKNYLSFCTPVSECG